MASGIELVVQGDDFGMCHAVNTGVAEAFTNGILSQASTMVACPWFDEAAALAAEHDIPLGVHLTLTCEWDYLRWPPLTGGPSLAGPDRTFHRTVDEARRTADHDEAVAELSAQVDRLLATGRMPEYFDVHMGLVAPAAYAAVCARYDVPFTYPGLDASLTWTTISSLSQRPNATKTEWLLGYLDQLEPGVHLLVCHVATPGEELRSITGPESEPWLWAEEYRKGDLAAVTDPRVRDVVDSRSILLTSVGPAFAGAKT